MNGMDEQQLRYFVTIAREGSLTRAGEILHVTQPAMSAMLRKLEAELGVRLFDRSANRIELNACGEVALLHAQTILKGLERLRDDVLAEAQRATSLTICFCDPGPQWYVVPRFLVDCPDVEVKEEMMDASDPARMLRDRECDIYIAPAPLRAKDIRSEPFLFDQCYLSVPAGNTLATRSSVSLEDIPAQTLLYPLIGGYFMRMTEEAIARMELRVTLMKNELNVTQHLIRTTNFLTMISTLSFELRNDGTGRVNIPITDPEFTVRYHVCYLKENARKVRPFATWAVGCAQRQAAELGQAT